MNRNGEFTTYQLFKAIKELVASCDNTDENTDNFERILGRKDRLALKKWDKLYKEIIAEE